MGSPKSQSPVEVVDLTGDSNDETRSLNIRRMLEDEQSVQAMQGVMGSIEAPAAYDGDKGMNSINETTTDATITHPCVSPVHRTESASQKPGVSTSTSTELASSVQQHVVWEEPIRGRLGHVDTGGYVNSLHLVIFPLEDGHDLPQGVHGSLWGLPNNFPAAAALGGSTNLITNIPVQPAESHSNHSTPVPPGTISLSGLPLSTDPAARAASPSVRRVALPPGDYSTPSRCHATQLSLRVAGQALKVRASEIDRFGTCVYPLQQNPDSSRFVRDIDLPEGCDYDTTEDCRLVACWLELAESVMKEQEDTLCRGESVPPVGNADDINLGVEEQVFGEPEPQKTGPGKKRKAPQRAPERPVRARKQLQLQRSD
ncbi:hypothetical protein CIHG_09838 [Coccidioides immitis H538.4]|uniref:Uncharacterized protein n=3 Tax=Coccidioides immitis TaxID=5501 RepID=A0A0J8R4H3_COCIT|nr:hypothetical protein CIRG_10342 [Coccidioides immitis RMSCC 2394]KMU79340.1 hypothetical protein CISG_07826 [Coccidioides immitis RMSCC 3703]KMU92030.1 hypothetical protein CIHG_09838 [Coccidioides immitis H538.4]TPX21025.1 hypothetical protein DIZ76_016925 [Coccidioides immitis]